MKSSYPTPLHWVWWRTVIDNIIRSFREPEPPTPAELYAQVDDRDERMRKALREFKK